MGMLSTHQNLTSSGSSTTCVTTKMGHLCPTLLFCVQVQRSVCRPAACVHDAVQDSPTCVQDAVISCHISCHPLAIQGALQADALLHKVIDRLCRISQHKIRVNRKVWGHM
jgi:hypothetical protein